MAKKKKIVTELTDVDFVEFLSLGYTVADISKETGLGKRTLEARLVRIRDKSSSKNSPHVVGNYFRKKLIK